MRWSLIVTIVFPFVAAKVHSCNGHCGTFEKDEHLLLQRKNGAGVKRVKKSKNSTDAVALALAGGGFLAHSTLSGIFVGLATLIDLQELLRNVEVIVTASAAGWFVGQLAYSVNFLNFFESMVQQPEKAGELYDTGWVQKFLLSLLSDKNSKQRPIFTTTEIQQVKAAIEDLKADKNFISVDEDFLELLVQLYWASNEGENRTWIEYIEAVMGPTSGGDLTDKTTLGSPVNGWAEGKTLLVGTSLAAPGDHGPGSCHDRDASGWICIGPSNPPALIYGNVTTVAYRCNTKTRPLAVWSPAVFSVVMGNGPNQPAPRTFCPSCDNMSVTYDSSTLGSTKTSISTFTYDSNTPMVAVMAAGSAFLGELITLRLFDAQDLMFVAKKLSYWIEEIPFVGKFFGTWLQSRLFDTLITQFPVFSMTAATSATTFREGAAFVRQLDLTAGKLSEEAFQSLAQRRLVAYADAGLSDNSAIGHAVASGLNNVVSMLYTGLSNLERLLGGMKSDSPLVNVFGLNFCPFCYSNFQVFAQDVSTVRKMYSQLKDLTLPETSQLESVRIGTLSLTTVDCPYFGVEAGRNISLHIISITSRTGIGGISYQEYQILVQELVDAFRDPVNRPLSGEVLSWLGVHI